MTDSRKLTDNELEQVSGGHTLDCTPAALDAGDIVLPPTPGVSFSVGNYVMDMAKESLCGSEIVYKIDTLNGTHATATMYENINNDTVRIASGQTINLAMMIKLDSPPWWFPAN